MNITLAYHIIKVIKLLRYYIYVAVCRVISVDGLFASNLARKSMSCLLLMIGSKINLFVLIIIYRFFIVRVLKFFHEKMIKIRNKLYKYYISHSSIIFYD